MRGMGGPIWKLAKLMGRVRFEGRIHHLKRIGYVIIPS